MTPARFRWGMILIQVGILLLFVNMGSLSHGLWEDLLVFFPIVIIAIGIEKIFTKSKLQFISYLSTVAIFAAGFVIAFSAEQTNLSGSFFENSTFKIETEPGVNQVTAILRLDQTDLTIRDSGGDLLFGRFDRFTPKPSIEHSVSGSTMTVEMIGQEHNYWGGIIKVETDEPQDWNVRFSESLPLSLECYGKESDLHLNLTTTPLQKLQLEADDSKIYLRLGDLIASATISIIGDDSDVRLRLPFNVGVRISAGTDYDSYFEELGFSEENGHFISDGFDSLDSKFDIELDENLADFSLDFF